MRLWLAVFSLIFSAASAEAKILYSWSQFIGENISFRTIIDDKICPVIMVNEKAVNMKLRHGPSHNFPITTCEIELAQNAYATLQGTLIPIVAEPKNILVIGDTGCGAYAITQKDYGYQDCSDIEAWTFPKIIKNALKLKPDLIIHTGDLHYRATQCKNSIADCYGDKDGLGYGSWRADFLEPMAELLKIAPIIFIKGNHENCKHAWEGWNKFFANSDVVEQCPSIVEPAYLVPFQNIDFLVLDNSGAKDNSVQEAQFYHDYIKNSLKTVHNKNDKMRAFLAHKPVYSFGYSVESFKIGKFYNLTLFEAMKAVDMSNIDFTLHGHIHHFSLYKFSDINIPPQVVVGNSGDYMWLGSMLSAGFSGGPLPKLAVSYHEHGFAMIALQNNKAMLEYFDASAKQVGSDALN